MFSEPSACDLQAQAAGHRIEVTPKGFEIDFHVGKNRINCEGGNAGEALTRAAAEALEGEKKRGLRPRA
jgi:hypothetical protein